MRDTDRSVVGRLVRSAGLCWLGLAVVVLDASAQTSTAALRGHVYGPSREPVPEARLEIADPATGYRRASTTNQAGFYNIGAIPPGTYTVRVLRIGFQPTERDLRLQVGETVTLDFTISEAAAQLTPITVTAAAGAGDIRSTEVATNVTTEQIENLPQGNRNFLDFAALAPGVQQRDAGISAGGTSVNNSNLFIDGATYKSDILPGGIAGQDPSLARRLPGIGRIMGNPFPQNAVQEFRVITQNYKAEYQKASGAVVTVATKSGTNQLSGDIFYLGQNDSWIAENWYQRQNNADVPNYARSQFGFSLGGPIVRDRTHFFLSYEGNVQSSDVRVAFDPGSGLPTLPDTLLTGEGLYETPLRGHLFFGKVTHQLNDRQNLMLSLNVRDDVDERDFGGGTAEESRREVENNVANVQLRHTLTANAITNEAQISFQRVGWNQQGTVTGPRYVFEEWGITRGANIGSQDIGQDRVSLRNDVTWTLSNHVVKIGANLDFLSYDVTKLLNETPVFFFRPDRPGTFESPYKAELEIGNPDLITDNQQFGIYLQDDWAATSRLTLSLGVRWDVETNNLNNDFVTPSWVRTATTTFTTEFPYFDVDRYTTDGDDRERFYGAIQPRAGFSYDLQGDGVMVVYGGGGLFYDRTPYNTLLDEIYKSQRPRYVFNFVPPGATPAAGEIEFDPSYYDRANLVALMDQGIAGRPEVFLIDNEQTPPYSVHASLGMRRALGQYHVSATGTLVNGYNYHKWIWGHRNPDDNTLQWGRVNELGMGNIIISSDAGRSWYRALLLQFSKPFTEDVRWGGDLSYTLSKTEVNTYHDVEDNFALDYIPGHELFGFNRVPGRFDERHRVVLNLSTRLPYGVRLSTITALGSGYPYTLSTGCQGPWDFDDPNGFCAQSGFERPPEFIPGFLANPPGKGPRSERPESKWFGPFGKWAYRNVDMRFGKDFTIGTQTLALNLDVINVFNFTNFNYNNFEYNLRWDTGQGEGPFNPRHPRGEFDTFDSRRIQLGARYSF